MILLDVAGLWLLVPVHAARGRSSGELVALAHRQREAVRGCLVVASRLIV